MTATNFTDEGERQKLSRGPFCDEEFTRGLHDELIIFSAVNMLLSITAFLGNALILAALHKETSLHPASKLLYRNLAITDLCVGIIAEPLHVAYWISVVKEKWDICYYALVIGFSQPIFCVG